MGIAADFKNFLEVHQRNVKKQEAKKTRIMGASGAATSSVAGRGGKKVGQSNVQRQGSIAEKRNRMKILPQHQSQSANRALSQRGITGTDYHRLAGEAAPGDERGEALELED